MTVIPELRGYIDSQNKQAIYIRVTRNGKRSYKKTGIKVTADQFENGQVKDTHPNHKLYNQTIRKLIYEAEAQGLTPVNKFPSKDFYKYCENCAIEWGRSKAAETLRQHKSEINKLTTFDPSLNLSSITLAWLNKYKTHLFSLGNKDNTVHKSLKYVRIIIRKAYREKLIESNPFETFEMPRYRDPQKLYLSKDQVNKIEQFAFDPAKPSELTFAAAWFSLAVYTGLRYSDLVKFNKEKHIRDGRLIMYTSKTGELISMPVSDKMKSLFELVDYKPLHYTNVHYNRLLKSVGVLCKIAQSINAHQSRHSAAMLWANAGLSQEVVAKLLGHNNLKSTSIYFKISGQRIDQELKKLE